MLNGDFAMISSADAYVARMHSAKGRDFETATIFCLTWTNLVNALVDLFPLVAISSLADRAGRGISGL